MAPDALLSVEEVARWLNVPVATIYTWRYRGKLPGVLGVKVGVHVRFRYEDIERWLAREAKEAERRGQRTL